MSKHTKTKSRIIRDPATPIVTDEGGCQYPKIGLTVQSVGSGPLRVKFILHHWQIRNLLVAVRDVTKRQAERLRDTALAMEDCVK